MRKAVVLIIVVILAVASLGVGYLVRVETSQASTETVTSTVTYFATSSVGTVPGALPIPVGTVQTGDIPINGYLDPITVDPNSSRVYVPEASSLLVVDADSHSVVANVTLPASSNDGVTVDDATHTVYASVEGQISEIDASTNAIIGKLPFDLGYLAYDPATNTIFGNTVGGNQNENLVEADPETGSVVSILPLGFDVSGMVLDTATDTLYVSGCTTVLACGSAVAIVDAKTATLVTTVDLNSQFFPAIAVNPSTNVLYVSGEGQLLALNGSDGKMIFDSYTQTCGPFLGMAIIPSSDQVLLIPQNYDYLLAYDGTSGNLVGMFSFPNPPQSVAYDAGTGESYVGLQGQLLAFRDPGTVGDVNSTLIGSGQQCP